MANSFFYSNIAVATTLSGSINNAVTSAIVGSTTGWPSSFPYIIALDYGSASEELVRVTANASNTLTFSRGYGGTSAVSHSAGAVVRHIYNAQDATDFRTHEAAVLGIHGVAGTVVGTTDIQTLSNKTLTSPAINNGAFASGGSFAGTYTGTPTFSGAVSLTGGGAYSGTFTGAHTLSGAVTLSGGGTLAGTFTGTPTWSGNNTFSGSVTAMTVSGEIALSNLIRGTRTNATDTQYETRQTGNANARWYVEAQGRHWWGAAGSIADANLYRNNIGELKTDTDLTVAGYINGGLNLTTAAWNSYTPTWTSSGTAPALGNGTLVGKYAVIGRTYVVSIKITMGPSTTYGTGNYSFALPVSAATSGTDYPGSAVLLGTDRWGGNTLVTSGASTVSPFFPASTTNTRHQFTQASTPETMASGTQIRMTFVYEGSS